ncbi:alpha/beta hydrolase [Skermania sp. ID1734]|uniref:alpha/beta hydrolase n=1 Tax=Skermania sp. ID1734 TaxID=2597516 RepID=UPI00117F461A|nr:alpha/beta hydrolase [Skermania sp. ID1734]TSE00718.1 alpha/beta hydrolase [Skermania sp. ID1734]
MSVSPIIRYRNGPDDRGVSRQSRVAYAATRRLVRPFIASAPITMQSIRVAVLLDRIAGVLREPCNIFRERVQLDGFPLEIVRPEGEHRDMRDGVVLYFHGGAFLCCGLNTHRRVVASIAKRTRMPVVSVDYRQLPRTRIEGSTADCLAAYRWLLDQGARGENVVFAGDSAGGFLTFSTALAAREAGLPLPAGLIGLSPLLNLDCSDRRYFRNAHRDPFTTVRAVAAVCRLASGHRRRVDPMQSPVNRDLSGLPPTLLMAGETEVLLADAELMARRLARADVACTLEIWRGQVHAFPALYPDLPESRAALREVAAFITERIGSDVRRSDRIA